MVVTGKKDAVAARAYHNPPSVRSVEKRVLIGPKQGASHFVMRHFTIAPRGHSPEHAHPWEHEVYVLAGRGRVRADDAAMDVQPGDFVFVAPMDRHQFINIGDDSFEFICVVPLAGDDG